MSEQKSEAGFKAWSALSKAEQEAIKKDLKRKADEGNAPARKNNKSSFALKGYVRCELAVADKAAFVAWESEHEAGESLDLAIKAVDSGYLLKLGESGNAFQASLCAATTGKDWEGYVLTAHASSGARAITLLMYKHCILMEEDWSAFMADEGEDFFR